LQRVHAASRDQGEHLLGCRVAQRLPQDVRNGAGRDQRIRHLFVVGDADFLERVRKRIVPHVVEQRRRAHDLLGTGVDTV
jgi:hypothetical protein